MDLTKYRKSTEFPMFYSYKSGSGGVEKFSHSLSILRTLSQTLKALKNLRKSRILRELLSNNSAIIVQFFCKIKRSGFYTTSVFVCFIPYISISPSLLSISVGVFSSDLTIFFKVGDLTSSNPCRM